MSKRPKIKVTAKKGKPPKKMAKGGVIEAGMFAPLRNGRDKADERVKLVRGLTNAGLKAFGQKPI